MYPQPLPGSPPTPKMNVTAAAASEAQNPSETAFYTSTALGSPYRIPSAEIPRPYYNSNSNERHPGGHSYHTGTGHLIGIQVTHDDFAHNFFRDTEVAADHNAGLFAHYNSNMATSYNSGFNAEHRSDPSELVPAHHVQSNFTDPPAIIGSSSRPNQGVHNNRSTSPVICLTGATTRDEANDSMFLLNQLYLLPRARSEVSPAGPQIIVEDFGDVGFGSVAGDRQPFQQGVDADTMMGYGTRDHDRARSSSPMIRGLTGISIRSHSNMPSMLVTPRLPSRSTSAQPAAIGPQYHVEHGQVRNGMPVQPVPAGALTASGSQHIPATGAYVHHANDFRNTGMNVAGHGQLHGGGQQYGSSHQTYDVDGCAHASYGPGGVGLMELMGINSDEVDGRYQELIELFPNIAMTLNEYRAQATSYTPPAAAVVMGHQESSVEPPIKPPTKPLGHNRFLSGVMTRAPERWEHLETMTVGEVMRRLQRLGPMIPQEHRSILPSGNQGANHSVDPVKPWAAPPRATPFNQLARGFNPSAAPFNPLSAMVCKPTAPSFNPDGNAARRPAPILPFHLTGPAAQRGLLPNGKKLKLTSAIQMELHRQGVDARYPLSKLRRTLRREAIFGKPDRSAAPDESRATAANDAASEHARREEQSSREGWTGQDSEGSGGRWEITRSAAVLKPLEEKKSEKKD